MINNDQIRKAEKLIQYIAKTEHNFVPVTQRTPYNHMGATIVDGILQAGLNYKTVVYPRVKKLLITYPEYKTTCDFLILIQTIPLNKLINWNNVVKINRITELSWFLYNNSVETEADLGIGLRNKKNKDKLLNINGIGNKTVDYLTMLSGKPAIAIDRHMFKYLEYAGVIVKSYEEANKIYSYVANQLNMTFYELDKKIWTYMSNLSISYV